MEDFQDNGRVRGRIPIVMFTEVFIHGKRLCSMRVMNQIRELVRKDG